MATKKLPPQKHLILAEIVQSWAIRNGVTTNPYVKGLVEALRELKNLQMWASIDALVYLPHPKVSSEDGIRKVYGRLNALRNTLVFAPVALTWLAVGQATSAFKEFVDRNATATVNFLEFWQNGYDVLPREWRLSSIAFADFIIVFSVIVITLVSNNLNARSDIRLREEELDRLASVENPLLTRAQENFYQLNSQREKFRGVQNLASERSKFLAEEIEEARASGRDPESLEAEAKVLRDEELGIRTEVGSAKQSLDALKADLDNLDSRLSAEENRVSAALRAIADRSFGYRDARGANRALSFIPRVNTLKNFTPTYRAFRTLPILTSTFSHPQSLEKM